MLILVVVFLPLCGLNVFAWHCAVMQKNKD